jgi:AcrR family transcriptional regulator
VAEKGYSELRVEEVVEQAAISQTTFYEHFEDKEDAFLVTYEVGHGKCLGAVERAYLAEAEWQMGVRAGITALFEFLASEPAFARMSLVDSLTASPHTARRSDAGVTSFARMLIPGLERTNADTPAPAVTIEAIAAGVFELCLDRALRDRIGELPRLSGLATYFALAPFIGDEQAAAVATSTSDAT